MSAEKMNLENISGHGSTVIRAGERAAPGKELSEAFSDKKLPLSAESMFRLQNKTIPRVMERLKTMIGIATKEDSNFVVGMYSSSNSEEAKETLSLIYNSSVPEVKKLGLDLKVTDIDDYNSIPELGQKIRDEEVRDGKNKNLMVIGDRARQGLGAKEWTAENKRRAAGVYGLNTSSATFENDLYKRWVDDKANSTIDMLGVPSILSMQFEHMMRTDYRKLKEAFPNKKVHLVYVADNPVMSYAVQELAFDLTGGKLGVGSRAFDTAGGSAIGGEQFEIDFDEQGEIVKINYRGMEITKNGIKNPNLN